ncbi:hypothetical protein OG196_43335 (plasmid) [Kitasatospora purpeofusca]|uniref:hypothetical protein n=1 Tax=Kitasatospora purpeofusca TaxID=67352 RepID=UPI002E16597B|nr:hypothetical protein OG196_43335 [Kitasatospora purpeofusca]
MGWFWDSPEIEVEGVVSDYVVYDVVFDEYNRVFIDPDHGDIVVRIDGAVVDGYLYPAYVDGNGRLQVDLDGDYD